MHLLCFPVDVRFIDDFYSQFNDHVYIQVDVSKNEYCTLLQRHKRNETFVNCEELEDVVWDIMYKAFDFCEEDFYPDEDIITEFTIGYPDEIIKKCVINNNPVGTVREAFMIHRNKFPTTNKRID